MRKKKLLLFLIKFILEYIDFIWELDRITDCLVGTFIEKTEMEIEFIEK